MMDNLIIVAMALALFAIFLLILLYVSLKRRYNEKHMSEDYNVDDDDDDQDEEIEIIRILIDNTPYVFEANGHYLTNGEYVRPLYHGEYVDGIVIDSNARVMLSSLDTEPIKLELMDDYEKKEKENYDVVNPKVKRYADEEKSDTLEDKFDVIIPEHHNDEIDYSPKKKSENTN